MVQLEASMSIPVVPPGPGGGSGPSSAGGAGGADTPFPPMSGSSDDAWVAYAQQMFPNDPDAALYIPQLKQNMMAMINTTISEMNTRQQIANEYVKKVAEGEE
jgi:hypothetical protein